MYIATSGNYGVALFLGWSKSMWNPKTSIMRNEGGTPKTIASFQWWTPWTGIDKPAGTYLPLGSHMVGWKYPVHQIPPLEMIGWTIGGKGAPEM